MGNDMLIYDPLPSWFEILVQAGDHWFGIVNGTETLNLLACELGFQ